MKKALLYILLAACTLTANAQTENEHKPILVQVTLSHPHYTSNVGILKFEAISHYDREVYNTISQQNSPIINVGVFYDLARFIQIGCEAFYFKGDAYLDKINSNNAPDHYESIIYGSIFTGRFTYAKQEKLTMYSGASFGWGYERWCKGHLNYNEKERFADVFCFAQVTYFGVTLGKKLYGTFEMGSGYKGLLTAGIGYKFN
ncbi:MAG: hypothetical protein MJ069_01865 [Salinivirgaceae bacterium]|nr:hypothetical protein [Salinivirgaceae bacterium]